MNALQAYYVVMENQPSGPFTRPQILDLVASKRVPPDAPCCEESGTVWFPLTYVLQTPQALKSCGVTETIKIVRPQVSKLAA